MLNNKARTHLFTKDKGPANQNTPQHHKSQQSTSDIQLHVCYNQDKCKIIKRREQDIAIFSGLIVWNLNFGQQCSGNFILNIQICQLANLLFYRFYVFVLINWFCINSMFLD